MMLRRFFLSFSHSSLSFLLLHEVPDDTKTKVINRIMKSVPVGGKAIFIEYHKPAWYRYDCFALLCIALYCISFIVLGDT